MLEPLEVRWMPSLTTMFAGAVTASGSGSVDMQSNAVTNDSAGNVYVTGSFQGTVDFDPGPSTFNLTATGGRDVFLARYNSAGGLVWAKALRGQDGTSVGVGAAIVVDSSGNVVVSGTYTGSVNFDPNNSGGTASAPGRNDAFFAKYDGTGRLLWARSAIGSTESVAMGYALAADRAGNVYAAGSYQNTASFGTTTLSAGGSFESFVTKLDSSGQFLWAKSTTGSGNTVAQAAGIAVDDAGNVLTTGFFAGAVDLDPGPNSVSPTPGGSRDVFVQKFDGAGNLAWAYAFGSADIDQGNSVAVDATGNVYLTGTFAAEANFNPAGSAILSPGGYQDPFLLKLSSSGQYLWAKRFALTGFNAGQGTGVALDASGRVFVAGYFQGRMALDGAVSLTSAGGFDAFLSEFDASGNLAGGLAAGGANFDAGFGVGVNALGQVAIAGRFSGPASFGSTTLPAQPGKSVFIAEFNAGATQQPPPLAPSAPVLQAASDTGLSNSDRITKAQGLTLDVTSASAGNLVELLRNGVVVGSRTGPGAITDAGPVPNGTHSYTARQTDALGRASAQSGATTVTVSVRLPAAPPAPVLLAADDSGTAGDNLTNVRSPRFTGTAEPNSRIQFNEPNVTWQVSANVGADGTYSVQVPIAFADGSYLVQVRVEDVAGNFSGGSVQTPINIDATPPSSPSVPALLATDDRGTVGDGTTNVTQPRLTGTAETGANVQLLDASGTILGVATAGGNGSFTLTPSSPLSDGSYALRARAIDAAGNASAPSGTLNLTIDTTPPTPATTPTFLSADDSGAKGDALTNLRQPRFTGNASAGLTVRLLNAAGSVLGTSIANALGSYTVAPSTALPEGVQSVRAQVVDPAGNLSAPSGTFTFAIDATPPAAPAAPVLLPADDSGTLGDGATNIRQPRLTGTAEASTIVQLLDGSGAVLGSVNAASDGRFTASPASPLADGVYAFRVQAIDAAGNVGAASAAVSLTILATAPPAPSAPSLLGTDDSGVQGDGVTNVRQPRLVGTALAGLTVRILNASGTVLGTAIAATGGSYSVLVTNPLADGSHALRAQTIDVAGNSSVPSPTFNLTVSTVVLPNAPSAPVLAAADDSGAIGDLVTNVSRPRLVGSAPAGATVQILNASGLVLGAATAAADGSYSVLPTNPLPEGTHVLQARAQDFVGNQSPLSASSTLTIDATPPATPTPPALLASDDSGNPGDGITNVNQPRFTGTTFADATVRLVNAAGTVVGTTKASPTGAYTVAPGSPFGDGASTVRIQVVDLAGNVSTASVPTLVTIDTSSPATPLEPGLVVADDTGVVGDGITSVTLPRLSGTAEPGATIQLLDGSGLVLGTTTALIDGSYVVQPRSPLSPGLSRLSVRAVDAAGNGSFASPAFNLTIASGSLPTPDAPLLNPLDDTGLKNDLVTAVHAPRLTGTTQPGLTVELLDGNGAVIGSTVALAGTGSYSVQPTTNLPLGTSTLRIRLRDDASNLSPLSSALTLTIVGATVNDFEGDARTDFAVLRVPTTQWIARYSDGSGTLTKTFGASNLAEIPVPGDYDGTGRTQFAVFRPSTGQWIIASPSGQRVVSFGGTNLLDIPVPADYEGVGHTQIAVFRPSTAQWFVLGSTGGKLLGTFGAPNLVDIPVPGDYEGLGHAQLAVFRPSTAQWFAVGASGGHQIGTFGASKLVDIPVPGDYDGIGRTQIAVFRPSTAQWFVLGPNGGKLQTTYGLRNLYDIPLNAPIGSLRKLGKIGGLGQGGVKLASVGSTIAAAPVASATATPVAPASAPARTTPVVLTSPRTKPRPAVVVRTSPPVDLVADALEGLAAERERLGVLRKWTKK